MKVKILNDVFIDQSKFPVIRKGEIAEVQDVKGNTILVRGVWISESNTLPHIEVPLPLEVPAPMTKDTNPKDRAATSRLDITLFPQTAIIYGALGMTEGDLKYGGYNYREKGVSFSTYIAALMRHLMKLYNGEWEDSKTGVPHLASMLSDVAIIIDAYEMGILNDDRPPQCDVSGLLARMEDMVKHLQTVFPDGPARVTEVGLQSKCVSDFVEKHVDDLKPEFKPGDTVEILSCEQEHLIGCQRKIAMVGDNDMIYLQGVLKTIEKSCLRKVKA
jgi:hypothetical protein